LPDGEGFPEIYYENKEICFTWLVPITDDEVKSIEEGGADSFEEKLAEKMEWDFSWNRNSFIL
jgi:hypothetical protein